MTNLSIQDSKCWCFFKYFFTIYCKSLGYHVANWLTTYLISWVPCLERKIRSLVGSLCCLFVGLFVKTFFWGSKAVRKFSTPRVLPINSEWNMIFETSIHYLHMSLQHHIRTNLEKNDIIKKLSQISIHSKNIILPYTLPPNKAVNEKNQLYPCICWTESVWVDIM